MEMKAFKLASSHKLWAAIGLSVGATTCGLYELINWKRKAHCDYSFDPHVPTNIPTGFPKWDYDWDKRQPYSLVQRPVGKGASEEKYHEQLEKSKCKSLRTIYLIRVGEYDESQPACEQKLTKVGKEQAVITANRLKEIAKVKNISFTSLTTSTAPVAVETADILRKQLALKVSYEDPLLEEGCPSLPEPGSPSVYPEPKQLYEDGSRIEAGFRKYFHRADPKQEKDSYEIIVCDANVIRYFLCRALQFPAQGWLRMMLAHGSLNVVSINPKGGVVLRAVGESGFMPPNRLTA